jgi:hypothetical protein
MKHLLKVFTFFFLVAANCSSHAQQLMQTINDVEKLKANEQLFIDNPLNTLLKEIGPEIKAVFVDGNRPDGGLSIIIFKFVDREEQKKYNLAGKRSLSILVSIKEHFEWNKPKEKIVKWEKEDAEKFGNLTIARIGVVGEVL